jgi:hypothetical protein
MAARVIAAQSERERGVVGRGVFPLSSLTFYDPAVKKKRVLRPESETKGRGYKKRVEAPKVKH